MELYERLKTILNESGLKQREFALSLGVTESYISRLIKGTHTNISESLALLIQERYGYSAKWIMTGQGDKFKSKERTFIKEVAKKKVESLTEDEAKAVLAFLNSIDEVRKIFGSDDETSITREYADKYMPKVAEEGTAYETPYTVPLLGRVAGGMPILAIQENGKFVHSNIKSDCALEIVGDSMEPDYKNGEIILIHRQPELLNGELGIIMIMEGAEIAEVTFKRFYQDNDRIILKSINPKYPDQVLKKVDVMIYGKVVGKANKEV